MNRLKTVAIAIILGTTCSACRYEFYLGKADDPWQQIPGIQVEALTRIAVEYATVAGQKDKSEQILNQAEEIAKTINSQKNDGKRKLAQALTNIAVGYAELGEKKQSEQILAQALKIAKTIHINSNSDYYEYALKAVATGYAEAGQYVRALQIFKEAETTGMYESAMPEIGVANHMSEVAFEVQMAERDATQHMSEVALKVAEKGQYDRAFEIFKLIQASYDKCNFCIDNLIALVNKVTQTESKTQVEQILPSILEVTQTLQGEELLKVLSEINISYSKLEQQDRALQVLNQAHEATKSIKLSGNYKLEDDRVDNLRKIAVHYEELGQSTKALQILEQAFKVVKTAEIKNFRVLDFSQSDLNDYKTDSSIEIADSYIKLGQQEKALQILDQALELTKGIEDKSYKPYRMLEIGDRYVKLRQQEKALQILDQVIKLPKAEFNDNSTNEIVIKNKTYYQFSSETITAYPAEEYISTRVAMSYGNLAPTINSRQTLERVLENNIHPKTLRSIALFYVREGQYDRAIDFLKTAKTANPEVKYQTLIEVAGITAEMGQYNQALEAINLIKDDAEQIKNYNVNATFDFFIHGMLLPQIAIEAQKAKKYDLALDIINSIANFYSDSDSYIINNLSKIANRATQTEPKAKALPILAKVQKIAETRLNDNQKAFVLSAIASNYAKLGQTEQAEKLLKQAVRIVQNMDRYRIWFNLEEG